MFSFFEISVNVEHTLKGGKQVRNAIKINGLRIQIAAVY